MPAKTAVPANYDLVSISKAAGSIGDNNRRYEDGFLVVDDVSQEALDAALAAYDPAKPAVPEVVTMRQARLALLQAGLLAQVNTAIASADDATKIAWEFSSEVQRNNPLVSTLAAALNLSDAQLNNLVTLAATL